MAWRPIDKAPTDGTIIDLWIQAKDCAFRAENFRWGEDRQNGRVGWIHDGTDSHLDDTYGNVGMVATHWMPLPEPPQP